MCVCGSMCVLLTLQLEPFPPKLPSTLIMSLISQLKETMKVVPTPQPSFPLFLHLVYTSFKLQVKYRGFHAKLPVIVAETLLSMDPQIELPLWLVQMFKVLSLARNWNIWVGFLNM